MSKFQLRYMIGIGCANSDSCITFSGSFPAVDHVVNTPKPISLTKPLESMQAEVYPLVFRLDSEAISLTYAIKNSSVCECIMQIRDTCVSAVFSTHRVKVDFRYINNNHLRMQLACCCGNRIAGNKKIKDASCTGDVADQENYQSSHIQGRETERESGKLRKQGGEIKVACEEGGELTRILSLIIVFVSRQQISCSWVLKTVHIVCRHSQVPVSFPRA